MDDVQKTFDKTVDYFGNDQRYHPDSNDAIVHGWVVEVYKNEMKSYIDDIEKALVKKDAIKIWDSINQFDSMFSTDQDDKIL